MRAGSQREQVEATIVAGPDYGVVRLQSFECVLKVGAGQ